MTLDDHECVLLERASAAVPLPASAPAIGTDADYPDFISNLLLTVLDLRLQNPIVNNAIQFYRTNRWAEIRTLDDIEAVLARFPEDHVGNQAACRGHKLSICRVSSGQ